MENFSKGEEVYLFGNICDSKEIKDALSSYSNLKYKILEEDLHNKLPIKKEKKEKKRVFVPAEPAEDIIK